MRSSGLVFSKENWDPLNTRVFSPDTKTGVPIAASTLVLSGLFKCPELQKEVTPESLTTPYSSVSFPMYRWMVSNNLPFHPMAQCTMGMITIYGFTSSKWSVLLDYTCRMAQCCETTSSLFRSLTNLRKVLLVSMTQSMRCRNLDDYIMAHSEKHFLNSWQIEGNHEKGLMSFCTQSSVLPLLLVWILLLVCPPIRMLQLNSLKCSSRKVLMNGYTYSPVCSPYAKPILTRFF